jgi:gliding motility-associated-like protein
LGVGNNIFRWTISNGSCTPSTSDVSITRSETPINFTAGTNQSVCATNFTLQATLPNGATGLWSVISGTGTFADASSPTSQVSGLSIGVNTFEWTVTSGACTASAQVSITREANPSASNAGSNQSVCATSATLSANTPTVGTGLWTVVSGTGTFANATQGNTAVSGLSIGPNIFRWTISGTVCPSNSSEVTITRFQEPSIANAGQDQQICANSITLSANTPSVGTGQWTIISGNGTIINPNAPNTLVNGLSVGLNIFQWTISNGTCTPTSDQVIITVDTNPIIANAGSDQNICTPSTNLNANNPGGGTGTWTLISGTGNIVNPNSPSSEVNNLGVGPNIFRWTIVNGTCSSSDEVTINRAQSPTIANAGIDQEICSTSTTLSGNTPLIGNGTWNLISGNGNIQNPSLPNTQVTNLGIGVNIFRWTVTNSFCSAEFDEVSIIRFSAPTTSNAGSNQTVCSSTASLSANNPSTGTGTWTVVSGTGNFANPNQANTTVSGLSNGPNVFAWTINNGPCSSTSNVTITREANPSVANAGEDQSVCQENTQLNATIPVIGNGVWTLVSGNGVPQNPSNPSTTVVGLGNGQNVFRWTVSNGTCPPSFDEVIINRLSPPQFTSAGTDQQICSTNANLSASTPTIGTGTWTLVSGSGNIAQVNNPNTSVSNIGVGENIFRWTISNGNCPSVFDEVSIIRFANPTPSNAGINQLICNESAQLSANTPSIGTGQWSLLSGGGNIVSPGNPSTVVNNLEIGINIFQWTISNGVCPASVSEVTITRQLAPTEANAGQDQSTCLSTTSLQGNTPQYGNGLWTLISGTGNIETPGSPFTNVTNLSVGPNVFQWTISNGGCPSSSDQVTITRLPQPSAANAGPDQEVCTAQTILNANTPLIGEGFWSVVQGTGSFNDINAANATVSNLSIGLNIFRWTINLGTCNSEDLVSITRIETPTVANAGPNQQICGTTTQLQANTPVIGNGIWSVVSGTAFFENINNPTTSISNLSIGNNVLRWTISNGICPPSFSEVVIQVSEDPILANAGADQQICAATTTLNGNMPALGSGVWSVVSGSGNITNPSASNSTVTNIGLGANTFRWTITNGACVTSDIVNIVRDQAPSQANAGTDQLVCSSSATLSATAPSIGLGTWSVISGGASVNNAFLSNSGVTNLSTGQNIFRWTVSNGVCPASTDDVVITRQSNPSAANAGVAQEICSNQAILNAAEPLIGQGVWTLSSGSGTFADANSAQTQVSGLSPGVNVFTWTVSNAPCPASAAQVSITRFQQPSLSNAGPDQQICNDNTILAANNPAVGTGQWSLVSGTGVFTNPNQPNSQVTGLSIGQNVFRWTISNGNCNPTSDEIIVTRLNPLTDVNAGPDDQICANNTQMSASALTGGSSGSWSVVSGSGTFSNPSDPNTTVTGIGLGVNVYRWTVSNAACPSIQDEVTVTRFQNPSTANAGTNQTICSPLAGLSAIAPTIGTGVWTLVSGSGSIANPSSPNTQVSGLQTGQNIFRWTVSNGTCETNSDEVIITRDALPTIANAGSNQEICGSNTTLSANTPVIGTGVWSLVSGEAQIQDPNNPVTQVIAIGAGNTILQWTISNGSCPSSSAQITISKTPPPSPSFAGENQTVCGNLAQLNAEVPAIGIGSWSVVSGSGTFNNPNNPNATASGLQFGENVLRWTVSNGNCPPNISTITILAIQAANPPQAGVDIEICGTSGQLQATPASNGQGIWEIISGDIIIDDISLSNSNFSISQPGNANLRWKIINPGCPDQEADLNVTSFALPSIAIAGDDIVDCANSTFLQANTPSIGTGTWSVINGSGSFANANNPNTLVSGLSAGDNIFQWTISNGVCPPSSDQLMVSIVSDALSTDAGPNQSVCATTTVLNAAIADQGIGVWSVISGTGIFDDANNPNTSVSNLSAGQNVFRWTVSTGTCTANAEVTITRNLPPSVAIAGNDFSVCEGSVNLSATAPQTGTGSWSVFEGSGNIVSPANPLSLVNNLGIGANSFIWTVQSGACPLSSDTVVITRIAPPSIADAGADQNICGSNTQLNANTPQIGIGVWTVLSGEATIMEPDNPLSLVENIGASGAVLQWSISNGICSPNNDQVQIIISPDPTPADAGQDQQICSNSTILQASAPINGTGLWTLIQGSGTIQNPSNANTVVSGLSIGENIFEWTVTSGNCSPSNDQVIITVDDNASIADAGADQEICADETSLNAILPQGATGNWTVVTGNATISDINDPQSGVTGLSNGTNIFRWIIQTGACPATFDEVIITRSIAPSQANAGINQQICANTAQLNAEIPTIGTGSWSVVAGNANIVNAASPSSQVNNLNAGINIFRWTVSNGPCPVSFADVTIQVDSPPSQAIANASAEVCGDEVQLNGQSPAVGVGIWTVASGGALIQNPSSSQTTASGLSSGLNSFQWTVNNGSCTANSVTITVNSFVPPSIADAGEDQLICETSSTLEALAPANGQGTWSVFSGTANIAQINNPQSPVSALSEGVNQLIWTVNNGICPASSDTLVILVNQEGNLANAGDDQTICSPSTVTNALTPQQGQGQWTLVSGSGNIQDIINPQTNITNIGFGTNIFQWTVSGGLCPSSSDQLVIVRFQPPSVANAGPNQQTCSNSAQLQANSPSIGIGTWQIIQGNGSFSNVNAPNAVVSNLSPGTNILRWSINNGNCPPSNSEVTIIVDDTPVEADAGPDQQICAETTSLSANTPAAGSGIWITVVGGGIIDNPTSPNTSVSNLQVGVNIFRWEVNNGDCVAQDEVNIIRSLPPSAAVTGTEQIICTSTTTLQANTPQAGTGLWTLISGSGQIQNPSNPNSTVNNIGLGVNVFRWTISNGSCAPSFAELTVIRQAAPTPAIAGNDQQICADQAILSGNIPSSGSGVWSLISGSGTIENALNPNTNVTNLGEGSNVFQWTIISGDCPPSVSQVTIERFAPITNLSAGTDMSICGSALTLNATDPGNASGTWSLISGAGQFFDAGDPNTFVSNLNFGVNIFRWTVSNSVCPSASADVAIVAFAQPAVANAGPDQQLCDTVTTLQANLPDIGSGIWTLVNGSGLIDNPEGNNTLVSDLSAGNNTFRYTITNGVCNTQDEVIITVFTQPAPANAGFDIDVCAETVQLQGAVSASGTLTWSSSDANISFNNINIHNPLVSNLPYGFTEFYLTASNGVCESSTDTMVVFRETEPSAAVVMDNLVICEDFVEINAEAPLIGQGLWNVLSGGANIENDTLNVSLLTEIAVGTTTLNWTVSNGVCAPNSAILSIIRFEQPTLADAGGDQISCFPLDTMQGNFPLVGNGVWTLVSGNANINNPNLPFTTISFPSPGAVELAWTISNGICVSSDTITINNYETPISDAGFDRSYCEGTNEIELKANSPSVGEGFWLVWDGAGIFADENDPRTTVTGMQEGVNVYEWWVSNGECQTFSQVTITLLPSFAPECQDQTPDVFIPEGFSPNNDGVNDLFIIQLKEPKRIGLKIYNRWGNLVFESDDYQNDWNGRSNSPFVVMGDQLPEGTYYYLITIDGEEEARKGYLTIWR